MSENFENVSEAPEFYDAAPEKKNNKTLWIIIAVVAVLLLCCCCLAAMIFGLIPAVGGLDEWLFELTPWLSMI